MKKMKESEYSELPKWPAFVVDGEDVTPDQAKEILVRTNSSYLSTNDRGWEAIVRAELGFREKEEGEEWRDYGEAKDRVKRSLGMVGLAYLENNQIASAYIMGPHGWCNWLGNIGCHYGNIGKWPCVEAVFDDWKLIAEAFPFLDLRCQLHDKEQCVDGEPVVEFVVKGGEVDVIYPEGELSPKVFGAASSFESSIMQMGMNPYRERGCAIELLREAVAICRAKNFEKV